MGFADQLSRIRYGPFQCHARKYTTTLTSAFRHLTLFFLLFCSHTVPLNAVSRSSSPALYDFEKSAYFLSAMIVGIRASSNFNGKTWTLRRSTSDIKALLSSFFTHADSLDF